MNPILLDYLKSLPAIRALSRREAAALLADWRRDLLDIMAAARLAASLGGAETFTCAIASVKTGGCSEDCLFCAQSARHGAGVPAQPLLDSDELTARAERMAAAGIAYMGLVLSGRAPTPRDLDHVCAAAAAIRRATDIRLCVSCGILTADQARALRQAGFTGCHHNLETSHDFYPGVCTSHSYSERVQTVAHAKAAGLRVCSGGIFGIRESWDDRLAMAETLAELDVDCIPVNFIVPAPGTPLATATALPPEEALAIIAIYRLMHPGRSLIIAAGRANNLGRYDELIMPAGANALMVGDFLTVGGTGLQRDREYLATVGCARDDVAHAPVFFW